ncbi:hypothetical protein PV11_07477 [Exophiala sideris]|uniref:DUF6594 domain-containing protein n=1 Tax=Exophiala sideris TaxID=1016849 RepID=A0A0D1YYU5_9EURO|nr:hypothetical protein PV11_07477 [Exophiala sideris]
MTGTISIDLEKGTVGAESERTTSEDGAECPSSRGELGKELGSPTTDSSSLRPLIETKRKGKGISRLIAALPKIKVPKIPQWWQQKPAAEGYKPNYVVRKLHEMPDGYPRVAAFLDSDENFMLYRRFGYLQSRLLLEKQEELRKLERDLGLIDDEDKDKGVLRTQRSRGEKRQNLLQKVEKKWMEYCKLEPCLPCDSRFLLCTSKSSKPRRRPLRVPSLMGLADMLSDTVAKLIVAARDMTALNKPTSSEYDSVWWWMRDNDPLRSEDARFIREREDLITLRPGREYAWLDALVESFLRWLPWPALGNLFRSEETRLKTEVPPGEPSNGVENVVYYTRRRIEGLVNTIMIFMVLAILIIPVYILFHLSERPQTTQNTAICIGVLLVSTLAFAAGVSLFSRAKRHEVLAASAGYCALLVVFIGNVGGGHGYNSSFANSG